MQQSLKEFITAVLQKWGWLVTGIFGGGVFVLNLLGINPSVSRTIGVTILVVCLLIACFLAYHELRIQFVQEKETWKRNSMALSKPIDGHIRSSHSIALLEVEERMETIHGHSDHEGLESDFRRGVLASDLMKRDCTRCGKPRNQRGDIVL
jgi:hypothetical protein